MEPALSGNAARAKMLSEIGLGLLDMRLEAAGDLCVVLGDGGGESFRPWLTIATGLVRLAHAVDRGDVDVAWLNPAGLLAQAYRGTGLFSEPLDVRVLACYPSWDRFVCAVHPRTGVTSLRDLKELRYPLRVSVRENPNHATRALIDQALAAAGFSLRDIEAWGGTLVYGRRPADERRLDALRSGEIDAVFDEGVKGWLDVALDAGLRPIAFGEPVLEQLSSIGWRRAFLPAGRFPRIGSDCEVIDFSGWALYTRASLADEDAYRFCAALAARAGNMPWEVGAFEDLGQLGRHTDSTPLDVPLHPGAARWYGEHTI
jgi:TRAP-type uncharacterized transport system substrate-binding protein